MGCHRSSSPVVMRADGRDGPCLHGLGQGGVQSCGVRACARCRGTGAYGRHAQHPVWWWEPPPAHVPSPCWMGLCELSEAMSGPGAAALQPLCRR